MNYLKEKEIEQKMVIFSFFSGNLKVSKQGRRFKIIAKRK